MSKQVPIEEITPVDDGQLLVSRDQARVLLGGISYGTILNLEREGKLRSIRLSPSPKAKAFFKRADVVALTETYWTAPSDS
jgi:hypothetical protein